ncbi:MAG: recombinase family protein [Streptosporangiaceae bacterium]
MQQPQPPDAHPHPGIPGASAPHPAGRPLRAVIAARLSQLQPDGRQGIGIDTQDEKSREFCEREGITVVGVAADTKSGTVAPWDRKNLKPWVTDPEMISTYDAIVAYKTDRLSRGTQQDFTRIEFWAVEHGKRLIIVDGPQYPARKDRHEADYWQWHSEKENSRKEWEACRERVLRATDTLRRENKLVGSVPWGFAAVGPKYDKRLEATELGRVYIPKIFDMVIEGRSLADVCEWLDSLHLRQRRDPVTGELADVPWWPTVLSKMLRNTAYRGHYWMTRIERDPETGAVVWTGKWEHSCEALIDARRFRLAGQALSAREKRGPKGDPMSRAMLRGAIRCPDCGSPMNKIKTRASSKAGSGTITYYRCWGTGSRPKGCGNMVRMDVADTAVNQVIASTFRVPVKRLILVKGSDYQDELEEVSRRMRDLDPDVMTDDQYDEQMRKLRAERDRLKALPAEPDRWEEEFTGELYADIYHDLPVHERGAWLASHGFTVHATKKEVSVIQGDVSVTVPLG